MKGSGEINISHANIHDYRKCPYARCSKKPQDLSGTTNLITPSLQAGAIRSPSSATGMHLKVGILAQRLQLHQRFAVASPLEGFAHLRATITPGRPTGGNHRS